MSKPLLVDLGNLVASLLQDRSPKEVIDHGFQDPSILSRIKYFYKLLKDKQFMSDLCALKDNIKSKNSRNLGNKMFLRGPDGFFEALELYNEAICFAEPHVGEELAIAYGNRSAVYLELKQYELCRANIKMAKGNGFPARLMKKLDDRDAKCVAMLKIKPECKPKKNIPVTLSMDGPTTIGEVQSTNPRPMYNYEKYHGEAALSVIPNSIYPQAADCLELKYDPIKRQHVVVTNQDLKPGQIVSVEMPIVSCLTMKDQRYRFRKCAKCYNENYLSLIPCATCPTTMYCSQKCMDESYEHHQYEGPISEFLLNYCYGDCLAIRMVLQAYASFNSVSDLNKFCKTYDQNEQLDPKEISYAFDFGMSAEEKYRHIHSLDFNENVMDRATSLRYYCKVAALYLLLTSKTKFADKLKCEADHDTLMKLIMRHAQISNMNMVTCTQLKEFDLHDAGDDKSINIYSQGIYPLASYMKHSCVPNVSIISNGPKVITYVSRVIKKGSQLMRSLGIQNIHYFQHTKAARTEMLKTYSVKCDCEACINDYPPHHGNLPEGKLPDKYNMLLNMRYFIFDIEVKQLEEFLDILNNFQNKLPCVSLNDLQLRVHKIMKLKYGDLSTALKINFKLHPLAALARE